MSQLQPDDRLFAIHSSFCTVMANEKRLRILWRLGEHGEHSVGELAEALGISMTNVSQHLRIMRDQRAVLTRKAGQTVYYRLSSPKFFEGCRHIHAGLVDLYRPLSELPDPRTSAAIVPPTDADRSPAAPER